MSDIPLNTASSQPDNRQIEVRFRGGGFAPKSRRWVGFAVSPS